MLSGIGIWQLLIIFGIVIMLFGTKKLRNIGGDLGGAIKGFKKAMSDEEKNKAANANIEQKDSEVIEGEAKKQEDKT